MESDELITQTSNLLPNGIEIEGNTLFNMQIDIKRLLANDKSSSSSSRFLLTIKYR